MKFSYVDASDPNEFLEEGSVDLVLSSEELYKYNSAGNLIEEEHIYYYSRSTQKRPERSKTAQLIEDYFGTKKTQSKLQKNVTEIYNYQHDDKLNPFSGLNVTSLAILNWGALFDSSQLLSINNLSSASSTQTRTGDDPSTRQITITYNNTYNSSNLLEGMTRDYVSVYTTPDFEDINESQYIYDFDFSCE